MLMEKMENLTDEYLYQTEKLTRLDEFRSYCLHKRSTLYLTWLCFALLLVIFSFFIVRNMHMRSLRPLLAVYYLIFVVHVVYRLNTGGRSSNILAPDMLFLGFYTLYHLGYLTLHAAGLVEFIEEVIWFPTSMSKSMFIINLGLVGFLFGYEFLGPKHHVIEYKSVTIPSWFWLVVSFLMIAVGFLLHIASLFMIGIDTIMTYGYVVIGNVARYSSAQLAMFFATSTMMGIFGIIVYTVTSSLRYGKLFHSKITLSLAAIFAVTVLLEGDRGYFVQMVVPVVLIRHYFVKRVPVSFLTVFLIAAFALMVAISVTRNVVLNPSKMLEEYKHVSQTTVLDWKSPLIETGGSFKVTSIVTNEVPRNSPYWKGQSYISAMIRIVPFLDGITQKLGLRGPPSYGSSPAGWVTYTYSGPEASGMGFTVCTEGYLNFGYPGAFLELLAVGIFIRWFVGRFARRPSAAWAIIMLGCLGASFTLTRGSMLSFTSACVQVSVVAGFLSMLCKNEPQLISSTDVEDYSVYDR